MQKNTYDFEAKRIYREQLKEFIIETYPSRMQREGLRVACFPGRQGLEVKDVYLELGIKPTRIYGIEENPRIAQEIAELGLGIDVYQGSARSFFNTGTSKFDIVNLDFQSQLGENEANTISELISNDRFRRKFILGTNFFGARESEARKEEYEKAMEFFTEGLNRAGFDVLPETGFYKGGDSKFRVFLGALQKREEPQSDPISPDLFTWQMDDKIVRKKVGKSTRARKGTPPKIKKEKLEIIPEFYKEETGERVGGSTNGN